MPQPQVFLYAKSFHKQQRMVGDIISHRLALILYFKGVQFNVVPVFEADKKKIVPSSCESCIIPFITIGEGYSDDLLDMLVLINSNFKEVDLRCDKKTENLASDIYGHLIQYCKFELSDKAKAEGFLNKIKAGLVDIDNKLSSSGGPYINGEKPCDADTIIYPKLFSINGFFVSKNGKVPNLIKDHPRIVEYMSYIASLDGLSKYDQHMEAMTHAWYKK